MEASDEQHEPSISVWGRQSEEPLKHFEWFHAFLMLGPGRSLLGAYNAFRAKSAEKSQQVVTPAISVSKAWHDACEKWRWRERAAAWDAEQRQKTQEEYERRWAERQKEVQEETWADYVALRDKARLMVKFPLQRVTSSADGKTTIVKPAGWSFDTLVRMMKTKDDMARLACGLETQRVKLEVDELDEATAITAAIAALESLGFRVEPPQGETGGSAQ